MATSTDLNAALDEVQGSIDAGVQEERLLAPEKSWVDALQESMGSLPWWVISVIAHAILLFLFVTFFTAAHLMTAVADDFFVQSEFLEPEEDDEVDMEAPRDLFKNLVDAPAEIETEQPILPHDDPDAEVSDHFETDNDMDLATARGDEDALSTVPLGGTGVIGTIGVGGGGAAGVYGFRDGGGRRKCIMKFGGSRASESAVEAALKWLSDNQEPDGSWDGYEKWGNCGHGHAGDLGLTGLATLAFLGAGYTQKTGKYRATVQKAIDFMVAAQHKDKDEKMGRHSLYGAIYYTRHPKFGGHQGWWIWGSYGYNHSICGLALAEAYGMSKDEDLKEAAQLAVDYSVNVHQSPYGGWRYRPNYGEEDLSNTGWFVMQLKSAKVAGLSVDGRAFQGAMNFLEKVTEKDGTAKYTHRRYRHMNHDSEPCPMWTAGGMVCRVFMGAKQDDEMLQGAAEYLKKYVPKWNPADYAADIPKQGDKGFYYWYYGTLGMFQVGGDAWREWNTAMRDMLIKNQCTKDDGEKVNGSWNPEAGGTANPGKHNRVFSTALGALCLEVYYRYLPMYGE